MRRSVVAVGRRIIRTTVRLGFSMTHRGVHPLRRNRPEADRHSPPPNVDGSRVNHCDCRNGHDFAVHRKNTTRETGIDGERLAAHGRADSPVQDGRQVLCLDGDEGVGERGVRNAPCDSKAPLHDLRGIVRKSLDVREALLSGHEMEQAAVSPTPITSSCPRLS